MCNYVFIVNHKSAFMHLCIYGIMFWCICVLSIYVRSFVCAFVY